MPSLRLLTVLALAGAVLLAALAAPGLAQVSTPSKRVLYRDGHGGRYLMDGTWLFRADPEDRGVERGFQRQDSNDGWSRVQIPNASNAEDVSEESQRGTVTWYRKDFRKPRGRNFVFRFEAVNYRARVYLNGREIGRHEGDDIPFEIPANRLSGGVNRLVVRVDNRRQRGTSPAPASRRAGPPAAAGGTTTASCAKSTCAGSAASTSWTSASGRSCRAGAARPRWRSPPPCATPAAGARPRG